MWFTHNIDSKYSEYHGATRAVNAVKNNEEVKSNCEALQPTRQKRCRSSYFWFGLFWMQTCPRCFSSSPLLGLFLFTCTQYSCLRITKRTAQSTQEAVWQGTRGSFSNIFFLSPPFSLHLDFGLGWTGERRRRRGLISLPPQSLIHFALPTHQGDRI